MSATRNYTSRSNLIMPRAFLINRKNSYDKNRKNRTNWCPVTPPPSPDDMPENLCLKNADHHMSPVCAHQNKYSPARPSYSSSMHDGVLNLKNTHSNDCFDSCAVDLSISAKTDSSTSCSSHYGSSLSSPLSHSDFESDFEVKPDLGKCTFGSSW